MPYGLLRVFFTQVFPFCPAPCALPCLYSHEDISSWIPLFSQFCLCPLGVRLLSAESFPPSEASKRGENEYEKPEAGVACLGCHLHAHLWVLPRKGRLGGVGYLGPGFTSCDSSRATTSSSRGSWICRVTELLPWEHDEHLEIHPDTESLFFTFK